MPRKPTVTASSNGQKGDKQRWRPKYGRQIIGTYVADPEEAKANGYDFLRRTEAVDREQVTVREWYLRWTDDDSGAYTSAKGRSEGTARHYRERVKLFVADYGDMLLADIDKVTARTWASRNPARAREVRTMFGDAYADDVIASNPFAKLDVKAMAVKTRKEISPLTEPEVQALAGMALKAIDNREWAPMLQNAILFAAYSGIRLGELSALCWTDIDLDANTILLQHQWLSKEAKLGPLKNCDPGDTRLVVLFPQALEALQAIRATFGHGYSTEFKAPELVFTAPRGARLNARNHWQYWQPTRAAFLATLSDQRVNELRGKSKAALHWHDLRHFTASWLIKAGDVTARAAAVQLGHKDGGALIQELYGHTYEDEARDEMRASATARFKANGKARAATRAKGA